MSGAERTAAAEWKRHWPMVAAAMAGFSFNGVGTITLGVFIPVLHLEFGWSVTQIAAGTTAFALTSTPLAPFAGALVDRWGPRPVALLGVGLSGLVFAAFSLLQGAYWQYLLTWVVFSIVALGIRTIVWNSAISAQFTASRGLAIAMVLSGVAATSMFGPGLTHWLIESYGWRGAYLGIGLGWGGLAFLLALLFFHDVRSRTQVLAGKGPDSPAPAELPGGLTLREAVRDRRLQRLTLAIVLQTVMSTAMAVLAVPVLISLGISKTEAVVMVGLVGLASLAGKLGAGVLVDRIQASFLPLAGFALPALGFGLMLLSKGDPLLLTAGLVCIGLAGGATLQMANYLVSRYAGVRHFGKIFGIVSSLMGLAGGIGPLVGGLIFDFTGGYVALMVAGIPLALIAGLAVYGLGPYPVYPPEAAK